MKIDDFFKTLLILGTVLAITGAVGYFVYQTFKEKPLDMDPPFIKEQQDTDMQLIEEEEDPLFGEAQIQQTFQLTNCQSTPDTQAAQEFLTRVNTYRAQNGVGPLLLSDTLNQAAAYFADDLLARNERGHIDGLGRDPSERATDCGYPVQTVGENTAGGVFSDPLEGWKGSPGHNENLLKPQWKAMGYGVAQNGGQYRFVWIAGTAVDSGAEPSPSPTSPQPTATPTQQVSPTQTPTNPVSPTPTSQASPTISPTSTSPSPTVSVTTSPQPTNTPSSVISIELEFPGIGPGENTTPTPDTKIIQTELLDNINAVVKTEKLAYTYENGVYKAEWGFGNLDGLYQLKVDPDNALARTATPNLFRLTSGQRITVTAAPIVGDLNNDNILDIRDYNVFFVKIFSCYLVPNCGEEHLIDFNANGVVDEIDYNILLRSFTEVKGR